MKILYLSVHEILEYDEVKLFTELGHEVYSMGAYTMPGGQEGRKRPAIDNLPYDPHFVELAMRYSKDNLHPELLDGMDAVIIMHEPSLIAKNWELLEAFIKHGGRVIWRSIGQSVPNIETRLTEWRKTGVELVRFSPAEKTIAGFAGEDAMIRFYKDPEEFKNWNGAQERVVNFTQSMIQRGRFVGYQTFKAVTQPFDVKVYGPGNENLGECYGGMLGYEQMKQTLRDNRVYFYAGTYPASYTLAFIEAMMTGIPIVSVGNERGNGPMFDGQRTFEVPSIIAQGHTGFADDNVKDLQRDIVELMEDYYLAKSISLYARQQAIEIFGKATIKKQWGEYL